MNLLAKLKFNRYYLLFALFGILLATHLANRIGIETMLASSPSAPPLVTMSVAPTVETDPDGSGMPR